MIAIRSDRSARAATGSRTTSRRATSTAAAFRAFDYHWQTHSTNSKGQRQTHTHRMSALVVDARVPLKGLQIRAENFFDKMKSAFGFDDIDFESAEFSRKFHVSAEDRKWAYDVLHARAIEFLLAQPHRYTIHFHRHEIFFGRGSGRWKAPEFEEAVDVAVRSSWRCCPTT